MYNLEEEVKIAHAVAQKAFETDGLPFAEAVEKRNMVYNKTLQTRALRFLNEIKFKIDSLGNQDIANLLDVLLANGLAIESEEELDYWINFLTNLATLRINQVLNSGNASQTLTQNPEWANLLSSVIKVYQHFPPSKNNPQQYNKWLGDLRKLQNISIFIQQNIKSQNRQTSRNKTNTKSRQNDNSGKMRDILQGKMSDANIQSGGEYWNEVMSSFESSMDQASFVENWYADGARINSERNAKDSTSSNKDNKIAELRGLENTEASKQKRDEDERRQQEHNQDSNSTNRAETQFVYNVVKDNSR